MKKKKKYKYITNIFIIILILGIIIWICIQQFNEKKIEKKDITKEKAQQTLQKSQEEKQKREVKKYPHVEVIKEYKGYTVAAQLEIPEIKLETYILQNYSETALNVSVTKFWGADPNEIGNFCVAGHNFIRKNMFRNLKELKKGDKLYISDNKIGKVEYKIYDIYKVDPNNTTCLSQETNGKREVTLITCTNNSKERIIVKAREE